MVQKGVCNPQIVCVIQNSTECSSMKYLYWILISGKRYITLKSEVQVMMCTDCSSLEEVGSTRWGYCHGHSLICRGRNNLKQCSTQRNMKACTIKKMLQRLMFWGDADLGFLWNDQRWRTPMKRDIYSDHPHVRHVDCPVSHTCNNDRAKWTKFKILTSVHLPFNHLPSPLVNWVHIWSEKNQYETYHSWVWDPSLFYCFTPSIYMDLFRRYICWNRFCKLLQSRVTGLCLALAVWLRSGGRGPHTRGRVSSYPQLVGDSSRMQHVAFLQSFLCPNQNVNYICLSVAVSTGERPSLFGVGACRKSVTTLSIITPPSRHTPDLYVLLGARGVRIAITPTFYRARCTLSINLTAQWVKQFTKCNRGSLLLHAHKYLHEGFRRQALDSMSAVSNRICFYKSVFANLRFEVYSL